MYSNSKKGHKMGKWVSRLSQDSKIIIFAAMLQSVFQPAFAELFSWVFSKFPRPSNPVEKVLPEENHVKPSNPTLAYQQGLNALEQKDYPNAISCFTLAIQLDEKHFQAWIDRAYTATFLGNWRDAVYGYFYAWNQFSDNERERRQNVYDDFRYAAKMWLNSSSFEQDITNKIARCKITEEGQGLRLREQPSLDSNVMRTMQKGEILTVIERGRDEKIDNMLAYWYKATDHAGNTGWFFGYYDWLELYPEHNQTSENLSNVAETGFRSDTKVVW